MRVANKNGRGRTILHALHPLSRITCYNTCWIWRAQSTVRSLLTFCQVTQPWISQPNSAWSHPFTNYGKDLNLELIIVTMVFVTFLSLILSAPCIGANDNQSINQSIVCLCACYQSTDGLRQHTSISHATHWELSTKGFHLEIQPPC